MVSERSERAYRRTAARFDDELRLRSLSPSAATYLAVATAGKPELTDASWRFIRAALKWWISQTISDEEAELFTASFRSKRPEVKPKKRLPKGLDEQLEIDLITILRRGTPGKNQQLAADMIEAGIATGLRPIEWKDAWIADNVLHVPNAKFRPGISGNGEKRELLLDDEVISERHLNAIYRVLDSLHGVEWDDVGQHVRRALIGAKKKLSRMGLLTKKQMKTRIYDARHQFAANAKLSLDYAGGEVAAAMGHRSAVTAHVSYGNRKKGRSGIAVKPSAQSVNNVDAGSLTRLAKSVSKASTPTVKKPSSKSIQKIGSKQGNQQSVERVRSVTSKPDGPTFG